MGRDSIHLTGAQFELLTWVKNGCQDGVYTGTSHRVSARALHNRGLIRVVGSGKTWAVTITPEGTRCLKDQATRVEAERESERREEQARAERDREQRLFRIRAREVLEAVVAAGGRLDLDPRHGGDIGRIADYLEREGLLPEGQRLAHEPTRMDRDLGVTAYLEPDFAARTSPREFKVPRQLRGPHPAVVAFKDKRARVSKSQIPRAARFLQALASAATEMGWKVSAKSSNTVTRRGEAPPDLSLRLPSREITVTVRELDGRGRKRPAFTADFDFYTRTERATVNKNFEASGRLEVTLATGWEQQPVLSLRDTGGATLEEQLPVLIRHFEIAESEAQWARHEEARRAEIRKVRWEEVRKEAFTRLTYERNVERLREELARRDAAAAMRKYADEVDARAVQLPAADAEAAHEWADWVRRHAERTDPINGPLHLIEVSSCSREELQPHMNGWSAYGPYRQ